MAPEPQFQTVEGQTYRTVTLDEWMMPLDPQHPARAELKDLRMKLAAALQTIDELERENSELNGQMIKAQMAYETKNRTDQDPAGMAGGPEGEAPAAP